MITTTAAVLACLLLGALGVFQALLAFGAPLGDFAWGGQHRVLPRPQRVGSVVSIAVYALLAVILLARAGLMSTGWPEPIVRGAAWVVAAYFVLGTALNLASRSRRERAVMTPVAATLGALSVVVAVGAP